MLLRVVHETRYRYHPAVDTAHHVVHLKPASHGSQALRHYALQIEPPPAMLREAFDVYGNTRTSFSFQSAHDRLTVVAESIVCTTADPQARDTARAPHLAVPWAAPGLRRDHQLLLPQTQDDPAGHSRLGEQVEHATEPGLNLSVGVLHHGPRFGAEVPDGQRLGEFPAAGLAPAPLVQATPDGH